MIANGRNGQSEAAGFGMKTKNNQVIIVILFIIVKVLFAQFSFKLLKIKRRHVNYRWKRGLS